MEPIFEKRISDGRTRSYVYALGKHIARVDGVIGEQSYFDTGGNLVAGDPVYFYHTDHLGSVKAVTDASGTKVWDGDYLAFGKQYIENKIDPGFEEDDLGFTGKGFDGDTGLYYFNARWYDADTGRFISEDPMMDPNNPNLYSYGRNNPINVTDPTGNFSLSDVGITSITGGSGYNPNLEITSPDLGGGSGDGGNNNNSNNNNGSSGNEKKSFWDNMKNSWNNFQEWSKKQSEKVRENITLEVKNELAAQGVTEKDPQYQEKLAARMSEKFRNAFGTIGYGGGEFLLLEWASTYTGLDEWFKNDPTGREVAKKLFGDPNSKFTTGYVMVGGGFFNSTAGLLGGAQKINNGLYVKPNVLNEIGIAESSGGKVFSGLNQKVINSKPATWQGKSTGGTQRIVQYSDSQGVKFVIHEVTDAKGFVVHRDFDAVRISSGQIINKIK